MVSSMYLGLYWLSGLLTNKGGMYTLGFLWWKLVPILMSMWFLSFLVHSNGTSRFPPGRIFTECASTRGMAKVVSGSSITVVPLDRIIFHVPSRVQMMPMKFVDVKSVPNMIGHCICLQTIKDCVNGWLFIVKVQVTWPRAPMFSPEAFLMNGW